MKKVEDLSKDKTDAVVTDTDITEICEIEIQKASYVFWGTQFIDAAKKRTLKFAAKSET